VPVVAEDKTRGRDPQVVQYALRVYGSTDLEEHQWKQCEDQMKASKPSDFEVPHFITVMIISSLHRCQ
jgi:hypothetical protein